MFSNQKQNRSAIEKLYPDLTPEEIAETKETMRCYVRLVWRIYQRLRSEKKIDGIPFKR